MVLGLVSIPFGFPGTLIILGSVLIYAIATQFAAGIGVPFFIFLCVLTLAAETADHWLSAIGAKRYGASTRSMWLSFVGGIIGAIVIGGPLAGVRPSSAAAVLAFGTISVDHAAGAAPPAPSAP